MGFHPFVFRHWMNKTNNQQRLLLRAPQRAKRPCLQEVW
jgi:hypothetical protein